MVWPETEESVESAGVFRAREHAVPRDSRTSRTLRVAVGIGATLLAAIAFLVVAPIFMPIEERPCIYQAARTRDIGRVIGEFWKEKSRYPTEEEIVQRLDTKFPPSKLVDWWRHPYQLLYGKNGDFDVRSPGYEANCKA